MQYPGSSPDILETTESKEPQVPAPEKELGPTPNGGNGGGGPPRAVSRSAMVKAVVEQEEEEKPVKNVCLVDTPQIFPATTSMTTRAVIESAASSSAEYVAPNHPKGINRMSRKLSFSRIFKDFFYVKDRSFRVYFLELHNFMLHPKSSRLALLICQMKFFVTLFVTFDTLTETFFARLINSLQDFLYFMK